MMWWNGSWAWAWLVMVPMVVAMCAVAIWAITRWAQTSSGSSTAVDQLDRRLAPGDNDVEYRRRRAELERR